MADSIVVEPGLEIEKKPPTFERIATLARDGVRSVVNLRQAGETGDLPPDEEGHVVRGQGMAYLHLPVDRDDIRLEDAERFDREVSTLPGPVVVHCASGRRASVLALAHVARKRGWSAEEALLKGEALGLEMDDEKNRSFVRGAVRSPI